jgi:hypothetical protein
MPANKNNSVRPADAAVVNTIPRPQLDSADVAMKKHRLGSMFHTYAIDFFRHAVKLGGSISVDDIPPCPAIDNAKLHTGRMKALLQKHTPIWAYAAFNVSATFLPATIYSMVCIILMVLQPYCNQQIVVVLQKHALGAGYNISEGYMWAILSACFAILSSCAMQAAYQCGYTGARRSFAAYCSLIYEKPSLITESSLHAKHAEGSILNMMSVDGLTITQVTLFSQVTYSIGQYILPYILVDHRCVTHIQIISSSR